MLNQKTEVTINKESFIFTAISLLAKLPEREQEKFCYRLDGYVAGYENASKREAGHAQALNRAAAL